MAGNHQNAQIWPIFYGQNRDLPVIHQKCPTNYVKAFESILNYRDLFWLNGTRLFTTTKRPVQKLYTFQIIVEDGIYIRPVFYYCHSCSLAPQTFIRLVDSGITEALI